MLIRSIIIFAASATSAIAACDADQQTFVSCQIEDRNAQLAVCFDAETVTYSFGPAGNPELTLSEPVTTVAYTPWPGVGRAIWEEVTFQNGNYSYSAYGGFDRMFGDETEEDHPTPQFGGVVVRRDDAIVAELSCDPATVDFGWGEGLWDAKHAAGLTWDYGTHGWLEATE